MPRRAAPPRRPPPPDRSADRPEDTPVRRSRDDGAVGVVPPQDRLPRDARAAWRQCLTVVNPSLERRRVVGAHTAQEAIDERLPGTGAADVPLVSTAVVSDLART